MKPAPPGRSVFRLTWPQERLLPIVLTLAFGMAASSWALSPGKLLTQYPLDHYQADQGLPQSTVQGIGQTPEGYLWSATEEGLARFDGVTFTAFDRENTPAIQSNLLHALCTTSDGTLWFGTVGAGLGSLKSGVFRSFGTAEGLPSLFVSVLCPGPGGSLWIGTYGGGIARLAGGRVEKVAASEKLPDQLIVALAPGRDGSLWAATNGGALAHFSGGGLTLLPALPGPQPCGVLALLEGGDGALWIGTTSAGLLRLVPGGSPEAPPWASSLVGSGISSLMEDREGALWIGCESGELHRVVRGRMETLGAGGGMPASPLRCLYEDGSGDLWVGTQTAGLLRLRNGRFTPFSTSEGLSSDYAAGILESRDGALWVATHGGGLNRVAGGTVRTYRKADGLPSNQLWSLLEASDGTFWIGSDGGGLCTFEGGKFSPFGKSRGFPAQIVTSLFEDRSGAIWVGTNGDGLYRIRGPLLDHFGRAEGLPSLAVHGILQDSHGRLWAGTEEGIARLEEGRFRAFTTREGLPNNLIVTLTLDLQGVLWVGTAGGIAVCREGRFQRVTKAEGLFDNTILQILDDGLGNLWMGCNKGIFRTSRQGVMDVAEGRASKVECVAYGRSDGMKSAECNGAFTPSGLRLKDGRLCFPTIRGVVFVDPASVVSPMPPPEVLVERVTHDGISDPRSDPLTLPRGVRHFEIHYTALEGYAPEKAQFRFRMEGFDGGWIEAGTRRVAYYTNLRPGRYRFRVVAANSEGVWSPEGDVVQIVIPPRFYETPAFRWGLGLALVLLAGLGYNLRVRSLRRRQQELERQVRRRTGELQVANDALGERSRELEELNRELERISMQDALTGLANRRHFDERLGQEWRRAERSGSPIALVSFDVDFFKEYNDAYGHPEGDACLKTLGERLSAAFGRAGDLPSRLGGDEFSVILADTGLEEAAHQAEKVRRAFESLGIPNRASRVAGVVTLSVGAAAGRPWPGMGPDDLLRAADKALYAAKEQGKNRVCAEDLRPGP